MTTDELAMMSRSKRSRLSQPPIYKAIGERIKTEREAAGLSQNDLAERIGTHRPSISVIEKGQQKCAVHELIAIARALHVSVCYLLLGLEGD